jgi:hypothetical protein
MCKMMLAAVTMAVGILIWTTPAGAGATPAEKCAAAKAKAAAKKIAGKLTCFQKVAGKAPFTGCKLDADCSSAGGTCKLFPCTAAADCGPTGTCTSGSCDTGICVKGCMADADCGTTGACRGAVCVTTCQTDADCAPGSCIFTGTGGFCTGADPACLGKATAAFTAAFAKADGSTPCEGTADGVETSIDDCISAAIGDLTSNYKVPLAGKCEGAKVKAIAKDLAGQLGCYGKASGKGIPVDPTCLAKPTGAFPTAFQKASAKAACTGTNDAVNATIGLCIPPIANALPPVAVGCGNGIVDPGETCDDGNTVDEDTVAYDPANIDTCPANCMVAACTPAAGTDVVKVNITTPQALGGVTIFVDYPEGKIHNPTVQNSTDDLDQTNDLKYGVLVVSTALSTPATTGHLYDLSFSNCQGSPVAASDFVCSIKDAADATGTTISTTGISCTVSLN